MKRSINYIILILFTTMLNELHSQSCTIEELLITSTTTGCGGYTFSYIINYANATPPCESVSSSSDLTAQSILWNFGDGSSSSQDNPFHSYTSNGLYTVELTILETTGEGGSLPIYTESIEIAISGLPELSFSSSYTCSSNTVSSTIINYNSNYTYAVNYGEGGTNESVTSAAFTKTYSTPGVYSITLYVDGGTNCPPVSYSQTVEVGSLQSFFTIESDYCEGEILEPLQGSVPNGSNYTWELYEDVTQISSSSIQYPNFILNSASTDYRIVLRIDNGPCGISTYGQDFVVHPQLSLPSIISNNNICENTPIDFTSSATSGLNYEWDFGDGSNEQTTSSPTHSYSNGGNYIVNLRVYDDYCSSENAVSLNILASPMVSMLPSDLILCDDNGLNVTANILNFDINETYTYQWIDENQNIVGNGQSIQFFSPGDYKLILSSVNCANEIIEFSIEDGLMNGVTIENLVGTSCSNTNDGQATINLNGLAMTNVEVSWDNGSSFTSVASTPSILTSTVLPSGSNKVILKSGTCEHTKYFNIEDNSPKLDLGSTASFCSINTGEITANATGGEPPYGDYELLSETGSLIASNTTGLFTGLSENIYEVSISDANGCVITEKIEVYTSSIDFEVENRISCGPGIEAQVKVSSILASGLTDFNLYYKLSSATNYSGPINSSQISGGALEALAEVSLPAGIYNFYIESSSCTSSTQTIEIKEGLNFNLTFNTKNPNCEEEGGEILALVQHGQGNIIYDWSNSPQNIEIVYDDYLVENAIAGNYTLVVTDQRECTTQSTTTLLAPPAFTESFSLNVLSASACGLEVLYSDGSTPSGNYIYKWYKKDDDGNFELITSTTINTLLNQSDGEYKVEIFNEYGCKATIDPIYTLSLPVRTLDFEIRFAFTGDIPLVDENDEIEYPEPVLIAQANDATEELAKQYNKCLKKAELDVKESYKQNCLSLESFVDDLKFTYIENIHHYTLYYYDRAGRLLQTVPPEGVDLLDENEREAVMSWRNRSEGSSGGAAILPDHRMRTKYAYNNLSQLVSQETPDGGITEFVYDDLARLRFSRNEKQASQSEFSYTKYDNLGRIVEVGQGINNGVPSQANANDSNYPPSYSVSNLVEEVTLTTYDEPVSGYSYYGEPQRNLRNRVSSVLIDDDGDDMTINDQTRTIYSYDIHGNVEWLIQDIAGFSPNYIRYEYDLISGNVNQVIYNEFRKDKFYHKYAYDADNRLLEVYTSRDGKLWDKDASYDYYTHGPLKRVEIGEDNIQGIDYRYTIHSWLKAINGPTLESTLDPGEDSGGQGALIDNHLDDAFGMSLQYYSGDYLNTGTGSHSLLNTHNYSQSSKDLYNGNISSWSTGVNNDFAADALTGKTLTGRQYEYDQLNRIKTSQTTNDLDIASSLTNNFKTSYIYDANGNIERLERKDDAGASMDEIVYTYSEDGDGNKIHNKLLSVFDETIDAVDGTKNDITGNISYSYDQIGNLISETNTYDVEDAGNISSVSSITNIEWTVYGKVKKVIKNTTNGTKTIIYRYDAMGNRISKEVDEFINIATDTKTTYYVRDASGNIMSTIHRFNIDNPEDDLNTLGDEFLAVYSIEELPIYGSDRIGVVNYGGAQSLSNENVLATIPFKLEEERDVYFTFDDLEILDAYKNWITSANRAKTITADLNNDGTSESLTFCNCQIKKHTQELDPDEISTEMPAFVDNLQGLIKNSIVLGENKNQTLDFYGANISNTGNQNELQLYSAKNDILMKESNGIKASANAQPISMMYPNTEDKYILITKDENNYLYSHQIDMSQQGYNTGTNTDNTGIVSNKNTLIDDTKQYGNHMVVVEDFANQRSILYTTYYKEPLLTNELGKTHILAYVFEEGNANTPIAIELTSYSSLDTEGDGELQITKDGQYLVIPVKKQYIGGFSNQKIDINYLKLNSNYLGVDLSSSFSFANPDGGGTYGKQWLDLTKENLYYTQRSLYNNAETGSGRNTKQIKVNEGAITQTAKVVDKTIGTTNTGDNYYGAIRNSRYSKAYLFKYNKDDIAHDLIIDELNVALTEDEYTPTFVVSDYKKSGYVSSYTFRKNNKGATNLFSRGVNHKMYELKDHLGNVRVVLSDLRKASIISPGDINSLVNSPMILSYQDYYPFGSNMPGRTFTSEKYRFGFNGMEKDDEIKGEGNEYATHFRQYDPRLGRWTALDPMMSSFADQSPYNFVFNQPIISTDVNGDCPNGDCDDVATPGGNGNVSIPSGSATHTNSDGSVYSFNSKGNEYFWDSRSGNYNSLEGNRYFEGKIDAGWTATKGIANDTYNGIKSLGTKEGWKNLGEGGKFLFMAHVGNWGSGLSGGVPITEEGKAFNAGVKNYYNSIPGKTSEEWTHDLTYGGLFVGSFFLGDKGVSKLISLRFGGIAAKFTTAEGFLFGSINVTLPTSLRVGLYASSNTFKYGTYQWATIAPKFLSSTSWFGRRGLQITKGFQPKLGVYTTQTIEKGTKIQIGLVGPQKGQKIGSWLQIYSKQRLPFVKP